MTRRWWAVIAASGLLVPVGIAFGWAILVAVGAACLALGLLPLTLGLPRMASWNDVPGPTRFVRGTEASLAIAITLPVGSARWMSATSADGFDRTFLPGHSRSESLIWPIDTSRRGLYLVGPSRLEAGDPFGLVRRVLATREPTPVLVVPRVHPVDVWLGRAQSDDNATEERAGSETFHSLREYVPGDPQKLIHWKSSARVGKFMVQRMVDTTVPWLLVILNVNARAYDRAGAMFADFDSEAFERAVEEAASWAWHGCGPGQRVLLATTAGPGVSSGATGVEVTARTRESALDALALVDPLPPEQCGPGVVAALQRRQGVSRAVYVTGAHPETSVTWLAAWRRICPVTVVGGAG